MVVPGTEFLVSTVSLEATVVIVELSVRTVWLRIAVTTVPKGCVWA